MESPRIVIIGGGFVGKATHLLCGPTAKIFDLRPELCVPRDCRWEDVLASDMAFVCVPTPMDASTGECHTGIVVSVIERLRQSAFSGDIVVRSTVPVGFCEKWQCHFFPEFLTEKQWARDIYECPQWIVGVFRDDEKIKRSLHTILCNAHNRGNITRTEARFVTPTEAESIKLFRNTFLATKIAFCNEWYTFCAHHHIDYERVRSLATSDPRIGGSHTHVPGHDQRLGFGGTCLPKDIASTIRQFEKQQIPCPVMTAVQQRNDDLDRPSRDWASDIGRSVIR